MDSNELKAKIIEGIEKEHRGKMDDGVLDAALQKMQLTETKYHATGSIVTVFLYSRVYCDIDDKVYGAKFTGNAGGIGSIGGGALIGDVYTDDIERLLNETHSFEVNATNVYTSFLFFDKHSNLLGHFQAGAVSLSCGIFGGTGSWERYK